MRELERADVSIGAGRPPFADVPRLPRAGNCPACFHLWRLHGADGCGGKIYPAHSLDGLPCPCEHAAPEPWADIPADEAEENQIMSEDDE
jgi:hypothetical protein